MIHDALGREIEPGMTVAYHGRRGSSVWLNFAVVVEVGMTEPDWQGKSYPWVEVNRIAEVYHSARLVERKLVTLSRLTNLLVLGMDEEELLRQLQ